MTKEPTSGMETTIGVYLRPYLPANNAIIHQNGGIANFVHPAGHCSGQPLVTGAGRLNRYSGLSILLDALQKSGDILPRDVRLVHVVGGAEDQAGATQRLDAELDLLPDLFRTGKTEGRLPAHGAP